MSTQDRIEEVQQYITEHQYGPDSPIVQLLEIYKDLQQQVEQLKTDVRWLEKE